jgi:6-phosphogluconolactonase
MRGHIRESADEAAQDCALDSASVLRHSIAERGSASYAVSGGKTPGLYFDHLARTEVDWSRVHLFWVDERAVPPDDELSNYLLAKRHLIEPASIPEANVHRVHAELNPNDAAALYEDEIRAYFGLHTGEMPSFDLVLCGMGPDAHTASLFPGEPLIENRDRIAAALFVQNMNQWRVTLLPGVLLAARHVVLLITGEEKAEAVGRILVNAYHPLETPAQLLTHHDGNVHCFLDKAAAAPIL